MMQDAEIVKEETEGQVYGWIPARVFNCMKITTTTKHSKWGSGLF